MKPSVPKFLYGLVGLVFIFAAVSAASSSNNTGTSNSQSAAVTPKVEADVPVVVSTPLPTAVVPTFTPTPAPTLSNNNYYTNVDGNSVHAPAYSSSIPAGATAMCGDGTYSFSQHRSGTCSHHGGVAIWY